MRVFRSAITLMLVPWQAYADSNFARDVLPILRRTCFECHGPEKQKGGLRLDSRTALLKGGDSGSPIELGNPGRSELIVRVSRPKGDDGVMPARGETLSKAEIEILRQWIADGAPWPEGASALHWAYVKPTRPTLPAVKDERWPKTPIDRFILARLEKEGLRPSPEAIKEILLRRVSLDLTGLPPTPDEIDSFVKDTTPQAFERVVDRLLRSPQFGVKWARPWLDAAHYADSHGFQRDDLRDLWPYRDWVVNALNADMPFDRFTIEQLAGDLLPKPTQDQLVATGFLRCSPTNVEAGSDPEDTRVNQVFDRVNTVGTVWLGSTLECCQCHDHKYDPFSTRDYYRLFAFLNSTEREADRSNPKVPGSIRFLGPTMELKDPAVEAERARINAELNGAKQRLAARKSALANHDPKWEAEALKIASSAPREEVLKVVAFDSRDGNTNHEILKDGSILLSGEAPDRDTYVVTVKTDLKDIRAIKLEALTDRSLPGMGPGRGDAMRTNFVLNTFSATSAPASGGKAMPVKFVGAKADFSQAKYDVAGAIDNNAKTAWAIAPKFGQPHWAVFETSGPIGFDDGTTLMFTLVQNFGSARTIGRLRMLAITGGPGATAVPLGLLEALKVPAGKRTPTQIKLIRDYRVATDADVRSLEAEVRKRENALKTVEAPTTLIIRELPEPRKTHILKRGDFRTPGDVVTPGTPTILPLAAKRSTNRLDLAKWLVSKENPLTARVTVNRLWAELFGRGLVTTPEDFGIKGEPPTYPGLLDWLAVEFMDSGWSMKSVLRQIVLSAVYRQSAIYNRQSEDPGNRLLSRGPRHRLEAETIRDNALAIAGLLSLKLGGEPIRPPQPDGLWIKVGGQRYDYIVSPGDEKYRRGLYVVWKRAAPNPSFMTFDAADRFACRVKRARSNTPLQALTLLNDPVYVEAALAFAKRVITDKSTGTVEDRIKHAFRLAVARSPRPDEVAILKQLFEAQQSATPAAKAKQLIGSFVIPKETTPVEFSAWYAVCTAILNLDETITKG